MYSCILCVFWCVCVCDIVTQREVSNFRQGCRPEDIVLDKLDTTINEYNESILLSAMQLL